MDEQPATPSDRSPGLLSLTIFIQVGAFLLYPAFICNCHFHWEAAVFVLIPVGWGFYPYFFYRTPAERRVGWMAMPLSMLWIWIAVETNLKFAFA